jgi:16S rRNA processing protein RimM
VAGDARLVTAGVVGRPHGLDGSFHVERPTQPLGTGAVVSVAGAQRRVERSDGTEQRPLMRLEGVVTREAVAALRGELLLVQDTLARDEWLAEDLVGCRVEGLGTVQRVIDSPSCDLLELEGGELVPLISDAVERIDVERRLIEVDRRFLRLEDER